MEDDRSQQGLRIIDLAVMPTGVRYEDVYGGYMDLFQSIAMMPVNIHVVVRNAPVCWVPFLTYLDCQCDGTQRFFTHDRMLPVSGAWVDRTYLEVMCGWRPELTDALWKTDMQWRSKRLDNVHLKHGMEREFIVTNNGSFHRQEIQDYMETLKTYTAPKQKVVIVPCAADKPYPSTLHKAVLDMLPADYYLMNATGVLGLVPQALWNAMPYYDSGLPYEWRLMNVAMEYFARNYHSHIVVYSDYYALALQAAFDLMFQRELWPLPAGIAYAYPKIDFVNEVKFYPDYIDLLAPEKLDQLKAALTE